MILVYGKFLKKRGVPMATHEKHFRKRDAILEYLRGTKAHPSAETIYTDLKPQIPDLAMGTVYRSPALCKAPLPSVAVAEQMCVI